MPKPASLLRQTMLRQVPMTARAVATRVRLASKMRTSSLPELLHALGRDTGRPASVEVVEQALSASQRIVARFRLAPDTCLYRSLTRYALLRHAGHPARFMMALDERSNAIEGHAWIELDGRPLGETVEPHLAVTFSYPSLPPDSPPEPRC